MKNEVGEREIYKHPLSNYGTPILSDKQQIAHVPKIKVMGVPKLQIYVLFLCSLNCECLLFRFSSNPFETFAIVVFLAVILNHRPHHRSPGAGKLRSDLL